MNLNHYLLKLNLFRLNLNLQKLRLEGLEPIGGFFLESWGGMGYVCSMNYTKSDFANTTDCCWIGEIELRVYASYSQF